MTSYTVCVIPYDSYQVAISVFFSAPAAPFNNLPLSLLEVSLSGVHLFNGHFVRISVGQYRDDDHREHALHFRTRFLCSRVVGQRDTAPTQFKSAVSSSWSTSLSKAEFGPSRRRSPLYHHDFWFATTNDHFIATKC